jgi:hypothetical protein
LTPKMTSYATFFRLQILLLDEMRILSHQA